MKKIILLFVLSIALFSCENKDDAPGGIDDISESDLVGTWIMTDYGGDVITETIINSELSASLPSTISAKDIDITLIITKDPNTFSFDGSITTITEYVDPNTGQTQVIETPSTTPFTAEESSGTWTLEDRTFTFFYNNGVEGITEIEYIDTDNVAFNSVYTQTANIAGLETNVTSDLTMTFKK